MWGLGGISVWQSWHCSSSEVGISLQQRYTGFPFHQENPIFSPHWLAMGLSGWWASASASSFPGAPWWSILRWWMSIALTVWPFAQTGWFPVSINGKFAEETQNSTTPPPKERKRACSLRWGSQYKFVILVEQSKKRGGAEGEYVRGVPLLPTNCVNNSCCDNMDNTLCNIHPWGIGQCLKMAQATSHEIVPYRPTKALFSLSFIPLTTTKPPAGMTPLSLTEV